MPVVFQEEYRDVIEQFCDMAGSGVRESPRRLRAGEVGRGPLGVRTGPLGNNG